MTPRALVVACSLLAAGLAHAGGLVLPEPNAAALGRAGASTAMPDGPSAIYYNPAALAVGHGLSLEAGIGVEHDRLTVRAADGTARTATTTAVPALFVAQRLGDHFAFGVGVHRAPGQALEYPDGFAGRFRVTRASFGGITLSPTVAGRPFAFLAFGFSLNVVFADLDLQQARGGPSYETRLSYPTRAIGLGGSIGLWARLYREYLVFGWSYKSAVDLDHEGRARETVLGSDTIIAVEDARLTLPLPHLFSFALGTRLRATRVQVEARLGLLRDLDGLTLNDRADPPTTLISLPLRTRELVQLRAGVEHRLLGERLALRLGVGYDLGSMRRDLDPVFPDGDRVIVACGLGYARPDFVVDAGYLASFSPGRTASRGLEYPAEYAGARHAVGVTLRIRVESLGRRPASFD